MSRIENPLLPRAWMLAFLLLWPGFACALTVDIEPGFRHQFVGKGMDYLEDGSGLLEIEAIRQRNDWQPFSNRELNFGFSTSAYWMRFNITNRTQLTQRLIIENRFPLLDHMTFHFRRGDSAFTAESVGDGFPATDRKTLHSHFLMPLELAAAESVAVVIRVQSASGLQIPIVVWEQNAFIETDHVLSILYGVLYGLLLAMGLYHLLIFYSVRELSFLYYALFNFSILGAYSCLHGVSSAYLWPHSVVASDLFIMLTISAASLFAALFVNSILQIPQSRPRLAKLIRFLVQGAIIMIVGSLIVPYGIMVKWVLGYMGITMIVMFVALLLRLLDGYPPAKYIFLGGALSSIGFSIATLGSIGIIAATPATEAAGYAGIIAMSMLDAFALSYRMNMDRQLRQDTQAELIENQRQTNANLDRLVRERTGELEIANTLLLQISNTDALTQLHNRRHFDEIFAAEFKRAFRDKTPLSILLVDIDHFKMINDTYGHPFGDVCLESAASFIRASIRRPPDFAARYGGEEFVVLLPNTEIAGALHIAATIRDKFNTSSVQEADLQIVITVSIGLAGVVPGPSDSPASLLKTADLLLYQAKKKGRNRIESRIE